MKKFLPIAVAILGAGVVMLYLIYFATSTRDELTFQLEQQKLANKFTSQIAWVRQVQENYRYETEIKGLIKWYFTEVPKLYKTFNREHDIEAKLKERKSRVEGEGAGHSTFIAEENKPTKESEEVWMEAYELVKTHWQNWSQGHYDIKFTAGKESVRLDILDMKPASFEGTKGIRADFVMWGAFSEYHGAACNALDITIFTSEDEWKKAHPTPEELAALALQKAEEEKKKKKEKGKKEKEEEEKKEQKIIGRQVKGECNPVIPIRQPWNFVPDFPPEAFISYFQLPVLPNESQFIDIRFGMAFSGRSGTKNFDIVFEKVKVEDGWKLPPGAEWKAQTIEATVDQ
ncbi:MAG: hypothetical protein Kow0090_10800 [Myxococcota bacterium]